MWIFWSLKYAQIDKYCFYLCNKYFYHSLCPRHCSVQFTNIHLIPGTTLQNTYCYHYFNDEETSTERLNNKLLQLVYGGSWPHKEHNEAHITERKRGRENWCPSINLQTLSLSLHSNLDFIYTRQFGLNHDFMEVRCMYYYICSYYYLKPLNADSIFHKQTKCFTQTHWVIGSDFLHFILFFKCYFIYK